MNSGLGAVGANPADLCAKRDASWNSFVQSQNSQAFSALMTTSMLLGGPESMNTLWGPAGKTPLAKGSGGPVIGDLDPVTGKVMIRDPELPVPDRIGQGGGWGEGGRQVCRTECGL